jgi:phage gpG-like protein
MNVTITITGDRAELQKLAVAGKAVLDLSSELHSTGEYLKEWFGSFPFASEGQIYGERWDALSPRYAVAKAKTYRGKTLLVASGRMQRAFEFQSTSDFLRVFNTTEYFQYHQLGSNKMPQRQVMAFSSDNIDGIKSIIRDGVQKKLKALL